MLREALKAICLCFQVSNVAEIYAMIVDNHVMSQLEGPENALVLSENEAKVSYETIFRSFPFFRLNSSNSKPFMLTWDKL